jgi:16S rRNA (uracil1498-N3)-methyltransferase
MTRRRFFAPRTAFAADATSLTLAREEVRHLRDVLRLSVGDEAFVFDGCGKEFRCMIRHIMRESAELEVIEEVNSSRSESSLRLTLAVALLKGEKFDLVVQKATELGVTGIVPMITKLADVRLRDDADSNRRVARWQRIAVEAAKQSGRTVVPQIVAPLAFESVIVIEESGPRLMFAERNGQSLAVIKDEFKQEFSSMTAMVGSEGGWTDEEIAKARDLGWRVVTLAGRRLRAETAAIAVTVLLQHLFGDLG